jgi:hypothetical protein
MIQLAAPTICSFDRLLFLEYHSQRRGFSSGGFAPHTTTSRSDTGSVAGLQLQPRGGRIDFVTSSLLHLLFTSETRSTSVQTHVQLVIWEARGMQTVSNSCGCHTQSTTVSPRVGLHPSDLQARSAELSTRRSRCFGLTPTPLENLELITTMTCIFG